MTHYFFIGLEKETEVIIMVELQNFVYFMNKFSLGFSSDLLQKLPPNWNIHF